MAEQAQETPQTVHDFAASYWDLWIAPVKAQALHATGAKRKKLNAEVARLLKDRETQIIARYGKMP